MILKRRFPNFSDNGPEFWTEHNVNTIEDILALEWVQRWKSLYYSDNNPYLNPTLYPYNLIGTIVNEEKQIRYIVIGLFTEDPSHLGIPKYNR